MGPPELRSVSGVVAPERKCQPGATELWLADSALYLQNKNVDRSINRLNRRISATTIPPGRFWHIQK